MTPGRELQTYATALIAAATRREVAHAFLDTGVAAAGARGGNVFLAGDGALRLVTLTGAPDEAVLPFRVLSFSARVPNAEAFRTGEPVWLHSRDEIVDQFPSVRALADASGDGAWAAVPLEGEAGCLGVIGFQFAEPQAFGDEQRARLLEIAKLSARALERAARHDAERDMRAFQHRLIGIAGHELRNPLTVVLSVAEQLARLATGEREHKAAARLFRNARRMDRIVRDLLDYASVQAEGRLPIAPRAVDFHELCVRVLASLSSVHPELPVTYQRGDAPHGLWDPDRLEQLLENLLTNALKYGAPDRPVYVGWYADAAELVLKVHNHGTPIQPAVLPYIFDPFRRGEDHGSRDSQGLGLYIVNQIANAHGGRVEVRSDLESGTTFVVHLPRAAPATAANVRVS
jgi:signal transduction histidine kinase